MSLSVTLPLPARMVPPARPAHSGDVSRLMDGVARQNDGDGVRVDGPDDDDIRGWLPPGTRLAQRVIEQRVIIRVPMMRGGRAVQEEREREEDAPPRRVEWEERKGPRCIQLNQLRAATMTTSSGVDLMLRDGARLRARFSRECRAEDLYSGFYIRPDSDGSFCAGRDKVLARSGANCLITDFRRLVPQR